MTISIKPCWLRKLGASAALIIMIFAVFSQAHAKSPREQLFESMEDRQREIVFTFDKLDRRVKDMDPYNPRKEGANDRLGEAKKAKDAFNDMNADNHICSDTVTEDCPPGYNLRPDIPFEEAEQKAVEAINEVNQYLILPVEPGAKGIAEEGTVPKGDIMEDFIPQVIRLLMRFASLAVLVAFVVSGVLFVTAFGNEERLTKAKNILYYTIIGFAFVALAFAIIKAVTDIDFFGFI